MVIGTGSVLRYLSFLSCFPLCSFEGQEKKILGKSLFSLLGSSSTFIAVWDAHLLSLVYTYIPSA